MIVDADSGVLQVLVCKQDLLCLRQEQPRISQVQPQHFPRVCAQAKSEVGILGDLGLSKQALQLGLAGMYTHDVVSGVCDGDFSLCVGICHACGFCNKQLCSRGNARPRGVRGGRHTGIVLITFFPINPRILPALLFRELSCCFQRSRLGFQSRLAARLVPAFARMLFAAMLACILFELF